MRQKMKKNEREGKKTSSCCVWGWKYHECLFYWTVKWFHLAVISIQRGRRRKVDQINSTTRNLMWKMMIRVCGEWERDCLCVRECVCVAGTGAGWRKCRKVFERRITQHHRGKGWVWRNWGKLRTMSSALKRTTQPHGACPLLARTPSVVVVVVPNNINEGATINEGWTMPRTYRPSPSKTPGLSASIPSTPASTPTNPKK